LYVYRITYAICRILYILYKVLRTGNSTALPLCHTNRTTGCKHSVLMPFGTYTHLNIHTHICTPEN